MTIRVTRSGGVTRIALDRPEKANALTAEMLGAILDGLRAAAADRVLVLTGTGSVFSAGADLQAARAGLATSPLWEQVSAAVVAFPGLSVALLNGSAAGGALGMVLACDLRVAVPEAKIFYPVMRLGHLPQPSDACRLRALVGPARAKLILMAGARIDATEALAMGLVDRIHADPEAELATLARDALGAPEGHAAAIKRLCDGGPPG